MDTTNLFGAASSQIEGVIVVLASGPTLDEQQQACSCAARAFVDVKESSKRTYLTVSGVREAETKSMEILDSYHLALQNLSYREDRLNEEVELCRNYKCLGLERITRDHSVRLGKILELMTANDHRKMLDKLKAELQDRQRLDAEQKSLQAKRRKVEAETRERHGSLGTMPSCLQAVKHACKPLARLIPDMDQSHLARELVHGLLPQPLSVIYSQLKGVMAGGLLVNSTGLTVEQESFASTQWAGLAVERSTSAVKIIIAGNEVIFYTLPTLGDTVVVEPSDATLINLFPGDNGDGPTSPATVQWLIGRGTAEITAFPSRTLGRPFGWAQWLGGLANGPFPRTKLEPSSRLLAHHLGDRLENSAALKRQLESIQNQPSFQDKSEDTMPKLNSWAIYVPNSDPFVPARTKLAAYCTYYKCTIHCEKDVFVTIELSPEYPHRAPRFLLQPRDGNLDTYSPYLKIAEATLNANYDGLAGHGDESHKYLLTHQLQELQIKIVSPFNVMSRTVNSSKRAKWGRGRARAPK
mmetsp:Transcript_5900/g.18626  ORF Transcript_5900/g.18626 Transcript_5900/m.18626 type:complete len:525 (-) Transcript_5900:243-1817(-)